jgi:hypothetical protein
MIVHSNLVMNAMQGSASQTQWLLVMGMAQEVDGFYILK